MATGSENIRQAPVLAALLSLAGTGDDEFVVRHLEQVPRDSWVELIALSLHHRIFPRLSLLAVDERRVPGVAISLIRALAQGHKARSQVQHRAFADAISALVQAGVDVVVLKGVVLQETCYPDRLLRPTADLDILVEPRFLKPTQAVLEELGYSQAQEHPRGGLSPLSDARLKGYAAELQHLGEYVRIDTSTGLTLAIDVHFRLSTIFDHFGPNVDAMMAARTPFLTTGAYMLSPLDQIGHLAYHSWWDTQSIDNIRKNVDLRLSHFADIMRAVQTWSLSCGEIIERAERTGIVKAVHWALDTTRTLFGTMAGEGLIDLDASYEMDSVLTDRWLQRDTSSPIGRWSSRTADRIFDLGRGDEALVMLMDGYLRPHTRAGMRLKWETPEA